LEQSEYSLDFGRGGGKCKKLEYETFLAINSKHCIPILSAKTFLSHEPNRLGFDEITF
jgi:hypothetical protein